MAGAKRVDTEEVKVGLVQSHFFDSGAFALKVKALKYAKQHRCDALNYYVKPNGEFKKWFIRYMDAYAAFVKQHSIGIDCYANVDLPRYPEHSWKSQQYLEKEHGLKPVPVIHYGADPNKWLRHYIERGYDYVGLGGVASAVTARAAMEWTDRCFDVACESPDNKPVIRLHGFGRADFASLVRYPWFSIDSASWAKIGGYGGVVVPHKRDGVFVFNRPPYVLAVSDTSPNRLKRGKHLTTITPGERKIVEEWFAFLGLPVGGNGANGDTEWGLLTHHRERQAANLMYFEMLANSLPTWPWPWRRPARKGFF